MNFKRLSRILMVLIIVSVVISLSVIVSLINSQHKKEKDLKAELLKTEERLNTVIHENEKLKILEVADNYFARAEYKEALESYESILKNFDLSEAQSSRLKERISRINEILDKNQHVSAEMLLFQSALDQKDKSIDSLRSRIDSLTGSWSYELERKKTRIDELTKEIKDKNNELLKNNKVKTLSFTNEKGDLIYYLGETQEGKANGGGVGIWKTGSIYKGEWKDNKRHGEGTYEWSDGHKYIGEFENDKRQGEGKYIWPSGERYEGEWKDGKRNGYGILYDKDGNIQFEGRWNNDKILEK